MWSDEQLINGFFYVVLFFISLGVLGVDTSSLIVALSGLIVAFAFMIGPASSKYFEVGGWESLLGQVFSLLLQVSQSHVFCCSV
jgi:hypothetical protein